MVNKNLTIRCRRGDEMTRRDDDLTELRRALADKAVELVSDVLGQPNRALSSRLVKRWGRKGSFKLNLTGDLRGRYYDYEAQSGGDMLSFIQDNHTGSNFADALKWARNYLGWPVDGPAPEPTRKADIRRKELEEARAKHEADAELEEAARINDARQIWAETVPIVGTLGERYLTQTRAIPICDWPDCIKWHRRNKSVVVSVTDHAGAFVGVQQIYLQPDATKDVINYPPNGKRSRGAIKKGAVKLPGKPNEPICFAEGLETGLSIWAATGFETWIVLGGLRRVSNIAPHKRRIIICCDNSRDGSNTHKGAKAAYSELFAAGVDVRYAYPHEIKRQDTSDFNDVLQEDGLDAVRARIYLANLDAPSYAPLLFSVEDARKTFDNRANEFFTAAKEWQTGTTPPVHAIGLGVGGGKTEDVIKKIVRQTVDLRQAGDLRASAVLVPEHRLSQEVTNRIRQHIKEAGVNLTVAVWRGREAKLNPHDNSDDAQRMCVEWETVREAEAVWADIDTEVCQVCPHFETCGYLGQKKLEADIWVAAHHMTGKEAPAAIKRNGIAAIVIDETPIKSAIKSRTDIPLDLLEYGAMALSPNKDEAYDLSDLRQRVLNILANEEDGFVRRAAFIKEDNGISEKDVGIAIALEWKRKIKRKQIRDWRLRENNKTLGKAHMLWNAIGKLVADDGPEASGHLYLHRNKDGVRIVTVSGRAEVHSDWHVPTLHIDARHAPDLLKHFWPQVEDKGQIAIAAPHQTIRQYVVRSFSLDYLAPVDVSPISKNGKPKTAEQLAKAITKDTANRKHRRAVKAFICRRARELGGKALVIGNKEVVQLLNMPKHIQTAWFGAVAGRDKWGDVRLLVILGRPQPGPAAMEWQAAAITGAAVLKIEYSKEDDPTKTWYPKTDTFRFKKQGGEVIRLPAQADCHPDALCERLREETCTGQIVQAIGRARGVNRKAVSDAGTYNGPVEVIVLTDAVLPNTLPVDEFLSDDDLAISPFDLMLAEGGIAFEDGASAAMAYPDLWPSYVAAKKAMQRQNTGTKSYIDTLIGECPPVRFQRQGPKLRFETAYYDPRIVQNPRAALMHRVGLLASFEDFGAASDANQNQAAEPVGEPIQPPRPRAVIATGRSTGLAVALAISERCDLAEAIIVALEVIAEPDTELDPDTEPDTELAAHIDWPKVETLLRDGGQTYGELAKRLEVSPFHLSNIKSGRRRATRKIADGVEAFLREAVPAQGRLF